MSENAAERRDDYRKAVKSAALDQERFLKLTLSKKVGEEASPWIKISVRPVLIKGRRQMQFSYFGPRKHITKNYARSALEERLDEVLALPFSQIHVQSTSGDIHVRITRKGKGLIKRGRPSRQAQEPILSHDRVKSYPLAEGTPDTFLQAVGIMSKEGKVRASMRGKFRQINEFVRIVEQTLPKGYGCERAINILDCGCGSAYLTFAAYHYLNDVLGLQANVVGIDRDEEIIDKCRKLRDKLGWEEIEFHLSEIGEFVPATRPEMVLSLHACDTATDEAIARGILWGSRVILAAPCCQHELRAQLHAELFGPMLRHGVLKQRLGDLLTDTFRALVLRIMGYRTRVVEFVSPEHTSKNVMIRAVKGLKPGHGASVRQYEELKRFWKVSPLIEELLGEEGRRFLGTLERG